jgi:hypothetical protein
VVESFEYPTEEVVLVTGCMVEVLLLDSTLVVTMDLVTMTF